MVYTILLGTLYKHYTFIAPCISAMEPKNPSVLFLDALRVIPSAGPEYIYIEYYYVGIYTRLPRRASPEHIQDWGRPCILIE